MKPLLRKNKHGEQEINWICLKENCPENCCGYFRDRLPNYKSIKGIQHDEILILPKEISSLSNKHIIKKKGNHYLKLKKNRSCPFFANGKCNQFDIRPSVCRAYPFYIDLFTGLNIDITCPGIRGGWTRIETIKPALMSLIRCYKKHIEDIEGEF
jgi:Fe-S-cluster containining protein